MTKENAENTRLHCELAIDEASDGTVIVIVLSIKRDQALCLPQSARLALIIVVQET